MERSFIVNVPDTRSAYTADEGFFEAYCPRAMAIHKSLDMVERYL